jgi:hypothetical protein
MYAESTEITLVDIGHVWRAMQKAHKELGQPIVFFNVMSDAGPPPTAEVRGALEEFSKHSMDICSHVFNVLEGSGFQMTIKRSIIAGMVLLAGKRGRVFVTGTIHDAVRAAPKELRHDLERAIMTSARYSLHVLGAAS